MRTFCDMTTRICIPVMGRDEIEVLAQTEKVIEEKPDILEWRMDYLESQDYVSILEKLHKIVGDIPLIATFRSKGEGGQKEISYEQYYNINLSIAAVGKENNVEFIDIEAYRNGEKSKELISDIHKYGIKVIGSCHNFIKVPKTAEIVQIMCKAYELGADVSKIAVMPYKNYDITRLIRASRECGVTWGKPVIAMAMGDFGVITRICPKLTGSIITFAAGVDASAPGQIECQVLRYLMNVRKECQIDCNIALIGFMGSGKTTIANVLSKITGFKVVDLDRYIEKKTGKSIKHIFAEYGEDYFRKLETETIGQLQHRKGQIISCGGGAVLKDQNVELLKSNSVIVRLEATSETIFERVKNSNRRPLLNDNMSIEYVETLMHDREARYSAVADITVNVDNNNRALICYDLLRKLEEASCFRLTGKK